MARATRQHVVADCLSDLVEPYVKFAEQGWIYTVGYCGLIVLVFCCVAMVWKLAVELNRARPGAGRNRPTRAGLAPA